MAESVVRADTDSQKRRSKRIIQAVPITVTAVDALGRPFRERTSTLIINCHGCRYQSNHYVLKNMWVQMEVPHNEAGQPPRRGRARVVWVQRPRTIREPFQVGVELEIPGNMWGIAFPPSDWFAYPDDASGTGDLSLEPEPSTSMRESAAPNTPPPAPFAVEEKLRVVPSAGADPTSQARQMARMLADAQEQLQTAVQETAARAVHAETRSLLVSLEGQLNDAAQKAVEAAIAARLHAAQQEIAESVARERDTRMAELRAEWSAEAERRLAEAREQLQSQASQVENARRAEFEQEMQSKLQAALEKLQSLTGNLGGNASEVQAAIEQVRHASEESVGAELRRWHELMAARESEANAQMASLQESSKELNAQMLTAMTMAESNWRNILETHLQAAQERLEQFVSHSLVDQASAQATERVGQAAESAAQQAEEQFRHRAAGISQGLAENTAHAEDTLGGLREAIQCEMNLGQELLAQLKEFSSQVGARIGELSSIAQTSSDELAHRSEALLDAHSAEMTRRATLAGSGVAEQVQSVLQSAGEQTVSRLAAEFEERISGQVVRASETAREMERHQTQSEQALAEHSQRVWQASERSVHESVARARELLAQVEQEFAQSTREAGARWLAALEDKATETSHNTFEALFKSAEWYEKKVHTQMQLAIDRGLEQAGEGLRAKAGEISGLFATELDHYSRSYVEHTQTQIGAQANELNESVVKQMARAGDAASANFTQRASELSAAHLDHLTRRAESLFEQNAARLEAHTAQVRSKVEGEMRPRMAEFQRTLSDHMQQQLAQGKHELTMHAESAQAGLRNEAHRFEEQLQNALQSLSARAIEEHKQRLTNSSNTWLLATLTKLNQQSTEMIQQVSAVAAAKLRATCDGVFAEMGETLRQRLSGVSLSKGPAPQAAAEPDPRQEK